MLEGTKALENTIFDHDIDHKSKNQESVRIQQLEVARGLEAHALRDLTSSPISPFIPLLTGVSSGVNSHIALKTHKSQSRGIHETFRLTLKQNLVLACVILTRGILRQPGLVLNFI